MTGRRILVLLPWFTPAYRAGGPIRTIAAMIHEHGSRDRFAVLTGDRDWGATERLPVPTDRWVQVGDARVRYCPSGGPAGSLRSWTRQLLRLAEPDVLYVNSVFHPLASLLPLTLRRAGLLRPGRVVIAPRGEFGAGALAMSPTRKRVVLVACRLAGLHRGVTWHASGEPEAADIRRVVGDTEIVVRENETMLPRRSRRVEPRADGPLRAVFISRVDAKKGLHLVLTALADVPVAIRIDVFGGNADPDYLDRCRSLADRLTRHRVTFHGALAHEDVADAFAASDVFLFPTAGENFGHAIAESLAAGTPVLVPDTTPWTPTIRAGGGEIVALEVAAWTSALMTWATRSGAELEATRRRAEEAYAAWTDARPEASVFDLIDAADRPTSARRSGG